MKDKEFFKNAVNEISSLNCLKTVMEYYGVSFKKDSSGYVAKCVFHEENTPSLRITDKGNKAIYNCFGCNCMGDIINFIEKKDNVDNREALKRAYDILNLHLKYEVKKTNNKLDKFLDFIQEKSKIYKNTKGEEYLLEDFYIYFDEKENPLYIKVKYRNKINKSKKYFITKSLIENEIGYKYGKTKDFDTSRKILYNLPDIIKAIQRDEWIFFVEGEKDANTLKNLHLNATTIYTKRWNEEYSNILKNSKVAFIGDSGKAGEEFKDFVTNHLKKCCKSLKIINLPGLDKIGDGKNKDVTDWLESGRSKNELFQILKQSLDLLNKFELQQDEKGIYEINLKKDIEDFKEEKRYLTNFKLKNATIYRNVDNKNQSIKFTIVSNLGKSDTIELDARECFSDIRIFRRSIGVDYTFTGNINDLIKLQQWILKYFVIEDISIYVKTGIREINNEKVLITNKGMLLPTGTFDTSTKAINSIHNIDFTDIEILNKTEAKTLAKYLFNFNSKENVYNTLGLGVANMLNSYARESTVDNLPILQDLGESKSGKSKALTILRLLFNNTNNAMSLSASTDFALLKAFDETFLPIFLDEVKLSKVSKHKINSLSNHIRAITEGYENAKGTKNLNLIKFTYNASLIISGEEEIQETAVKNRSNIVWYAISNFTKKGKEAIDFLCNSKQGEEYLRRFSKSLYLHVLNEFLDDSFELNYEIAKNKYNLNNKLKLENSRELNTAIYTILGLKLLYDTFTELGVDMDEIINLEEAADIIIDNLKYNVLEEHENGSKSEYEKILEEINHLVYIEDRTIRIEEGVHYKILSNTNTIAFDFKTIYDKLNKYYKLYKSENEKLLDYKTFTKMISKSAYVIDSDPKKHYKAVKRKVLSEDENGLPTYIMKNKKMFILKINEIRKLEMDNIFPEDHEFEEVLDNVIPFN